MTSPITKWLPLIVGVARRYRNPRNRCGSYDFRDAPSALWEEKAVVDLGRLDCFWLPFVAFGCLELSSTGCHVVAGNTFFGTAQPGELGIEDRNSLGGGFPGNWPGRGGWKRCRQQSAAGSLVTSVGLAAAGSQAAQLLRRLIKKDIGVGGHPALFDGL